MQYNATTDSTKYRPCIDLSRHINLAIAKSTVKLADLSLVQELIEPEDYMPSLDLENQYFQVQLRPDMYQYQYMGFMVPAKDGTPRFFQFTVMAYGLQTSLYCHHPPPEPHKSCSTQKWYKILHLHWPGFGSDTSALLRADAVYFAGSSVSRVEGSVEEDDTLTRTNRLLHLGFITDSVEMTYSITPEKWDAVCLPLQVCSSTPEQASQYQ
jgi:hypothetical protein